MKNKEIEHNDDCIKIIKGHDSGGYFWIFPVKNELDFKSEMVDYFNNWKEYREYEISIDETDVSIYLLYFLLKNFNPNLKANRTRILEPYDENTFAYNLEHNFFEYKEIEQIIDDIKMILEIIDCAVSKEDCFNKIIKQFPSLQKFNYYSINIAEKVTSGIDSINAVADFYKRFVQEMTFMINNCNQCDIITFMGP